MVCRIKPNHTKSREGQVAEINQDDRIFVSVKEAALMLGVSRYTMYELAKSGEVKSSNFGRRVLVDLRALKAYAADLPSGEVASA
jgi:excisionase family DNA binding protein